MDAILLVRPCLRLGLAFPAVVPLRRPPRGRCGACLLSTSARTAPEDRAVLRESSAGSSRVKPQAYISLSHDPYFNLTLEDHLFRSFRPADAPLLLLYRNAACVVLGRNQNPWTELDAVAMRRSGLGVVRRRSGGGAVYHDLGNTNYSFHVARERFTRDAHANLVARALNAPPISLGSSAAPSEAAGAAAAAMVEEEEGEGEGRWLGTERGAYVNARHDICVGVRRRRLDRPGRGAAPGDDDEGDEDLGKRSAEEAEELEEEERKVSGSAYKLISSRAYHHGTLLLDADLARLGACLHAPTMAAAATSGGREERRADDDCDEHEVGAVGIVSKGVASVRSKVVNLAHAYPRRAAALHHDAVCEAIVAEFAKSYAHEHEHDDAGRGAGVEVTYVREGDEVSGGETFRRGVEELRSWTWLYGQTPEFRHTLRWPLHRVRPRGADEEGGEGEERGRRRRRRRRMGWEAALETLRDVRLAFTLRCRHGVVESVEVHEATTTTTAADAEAKARATNDAPARGARMAEAARRMLEGGGLVGARYDELATPPPSSVEALEAHDAEARVAQRLLASGGGVGETGGAGGGGGRDAGGDDDAERRRVAEALAVWLRRAL